MFKIAVVDADSLGDARRILGKIYQENPGFWPHGLSTSHFDGGLWLVREKSSSAPVGFVGWQERPQGLRKIGYYSIGILPEFRRHGFAREAVGKILTLKSASVHEVRALVKQDNQPSLRLASSLAVPVVKLASALGKGNVPLR